MRSVWNEGPDDAVLIMCSIKNDHPEGDHETVPDFWPDSRRPPDSRHSRRPSPSGRSSSAARQQSANTTNTSSVSITPAVRVAAKVTTIAAATQRQMRQFGSQGVRPPSSGGSGSRAWT